MTKRVFAILISLIFTLLPLSPCAQEAYSLTLSYSTPSLSVELYRIADIDFTLSDSFKDYPIDITNIGGREEWADITDTLEAYITADSLPPDHTTETDADGNARFAELTEGLYLVMPIKVKTDTSTIIYNAFITAVSEDSKVNPKSSIITAPESSELKIIKQWKDNGHRNERPERITVDIYRDGELYDTVDLNAEGNWSYTLKLPDTASSWSAVERNVDSNYTVTFSEHESSIILTNIHKNGDTVENAPQTGDPLVIWPYIAALTISGLCIILVAVLGRRSRT